MVPGSAPEPTGTLRIEQRFDQLLLVVQAMWSLLRARCGATVARPQAGAALARPEESAAAAPSDANARGGDDALIRVRPIVRAWAPLVNGEPGLSAIITPRGSSSDLISPHRKGPAMNTLRWVVFVFLLVPVHANVAAQPRTEYRGYWVDTFNTALNNHADVQTVVDKAIASHANALFVQVRRRGDSWYLNSLEPGPDFMPIAAGFDPLDDLIATAHGAGVEVHAFVIVGAIWHKNPTFAPTATLGPPLDPNHVFNLHGGYDPVTKTIVPGPNNWLTRTLLPNWPFQGHRFGNDFWIDLGHPDAEAYSVDVLMHLVTHYEIDGLHLDRIRYPDFTASGQTPANGANIGYNPVSVARFQRAHGIPEDSPPLPGDAAWAQWRRDQVTNFVRRLYLTAIAVRPQLKISAALIVYGGGPTTEGAWGSAEAYWRVYQDWRSWTEEGILDIAIPMNYKREHTSSNVPMYDTWNEWTKNHAYSRATMIGLGAYLNGVEGTLRQVRRALAPSAMGHSASGVNVYAMATTSAAVTANPFSIPAGLNTPVRSFADFAAGLVTGKSSDGLTFFEDPVANPIGIFSDLAFVPVLPWKAAPAVGHLKGVVRDLTGAIIDTGQVRVTREGEDAVAAGRTVISTATDGGGFYGGVDLAPGRYRITVTPVGKPAMTSCHVATVNAGQVSTLDITFDEAAPSISLSVAPNVIWPPNGTAIPVAARISATDDVELYSLTLSVTDEYGEPVPEIEPLWVTGTGASWAPEVPLVAARLGGDINGRTYTLTAVATDCSGRTASATAIVLVPHDMGEQN